MALECPFCSFTDDDSYSIIEHVECCHPENGKSAFVVTEDEQIWRSDRGYDGEATSAWSGTPSQEEDYFECHCGEVVILPEVNNHMALHDSEETTLVEAASAAIPRPSNNAVLNEADLTLAPIPDADSFLSRPSSSKLHSKQRSRAANHLKGYHGPYGVKDLMDVILGSTASRNRPKTAKRRHKKPHRLGKAELGPYAHEDQMPAWLRRQLEAGAQVTVSHKIDYAGKMVRVESIANEIRGTVSVLAQLCEEDRTVMKAYLCHPDVKHVVKMNKEGGFCGYRNIQMMVSFIQDAQSQGYHHFSGRIPSILELQDAIEWAWDKGINATGRVETGGIKGTRKYIGTPEAQALLLGWDINCEANAFSDTEDYRAFPQLLESVREYFLNGVNVSQKVYRTTLPPLYFQHPGHSLTIVGLEERKNGAFNLLVLDPMFKPSPAILNLIHSQFTPAAPEKLLKAYRRGETYLSKYTNFEILKLTWRVPEKKGWNV